MTDKEKLSKLLNPWLAHLSGAAATDLIAKGVTFATDNNVGDKMTPTDKDTNVPSKWISVKDGLPEEADRYLCNIKSFAFPGLFYQAILKYDKHGFQEGHIYTDDVTHWMPLPEPPKGE